MDASGQGLSANHTDQGVKESLDLACGPPHGKPSGSLAKYWSQRYRLFSRFDQGILLDEGESGAAQGVVHVGCTGCCPLQRAGFRPPQRRLPSTWPCAVSVTSSSMPSVE